MARGSYGSGGARVGYCGTNVKWTERVSFSEEGLNGARLRGKSNDEYDYSFFGNFPPPMQGFSCTPDFSVDIGGDWTISMASNGEFQLQIHWVCQADDKACRKWNSEHKDADNLSFTLKVRGNEMIRIDKDQNSDSFKRIAR